MSSSSIVSYSILSSHRASYRVLVVSRELFEVRRVTWGNRSRQMIMSGSDTTIEDFLTSDKIERTFISHKNTAAPVKAEI